jgi:hypothetical protein
MGFRRVVFVAAVAVWLRLQLCVLRRDPVESSYTRGGDSECGVPLLAPLSPDNPFVPLCLPCCPLVTHLSLT